MSVLAQYADTEYLIPKHRNAKIYAVLAEEDGKYKALCGATLRGDTDRQPNLRVALLCPNE